MQAWLSLLTFLLYTTVGLCYFAPIGALYVWFPASMFSDCVQNADVPCLLPWVVPVAATQVPALYNKIYDKEKYVNM